MKNSTYSEKELLEIAQGFKKHLKSLSTIENIYPELNQDFIYRFKARFYEAQTHIHPHPLDAEADRITQELKQDLVELIEEIKSLFQLFHLYIQRAYPHDSKIWDAYGCSELEHAILDYSTFKSWLKGLIILGIEKKEELRAANFPVKVLEEIEDLMRLFGERYEALLEYLERKEMRNKVYKTNLYELFKLMEMVHNAASSSLKNDPESFKHLIFPAVQQELKDSIGKRLQYS